MITEQEPPASTDTRKVDLFVRKPEELTYDVYRKLSQLSPFGAGNPEPSFRMDGLRLIRRWASGPEGRHLRVRLSVRQPSIQRFVFAWRGTVELLSKKVLV